MDALIGGEADAMDASKGGGEADPVSDADALNSDPVFARLLSVYRVNTSQELATAMGEKLPTVKGWKQRGVVPLEHCIKAHRDTGCSLDWLVLGEQSMRDASRVGADARDAAMCLVAAELPAPWLHPYPVNPDTTQPRDRLVNLADGLLRLRGATAVLPLVLSIPEGVQGGERRDYEVIPKHVRHAAAGKGAAVDAQQDQVNLAGEVAFSFEWLRRNLGHTTGRLTSIEVRGDSMASTLLDGETILIDEGVTGIDVDGIYVFDLYGRRLVKRLQQLHDGTLLLISDNPNYQRETVPRDRARDVQVIGRMVWPRVR